MKIKESLNSRFKLGKTSDGVWLFKAMHRKDALGRRGIDYLTEHSITIVFGDEKADVGLSLHGDPVRGVPRNKCILLKGEPPIYNYAFGIRLNSPTYLKKYLGVLSNTHFRELEHLQAHFNSPQLFDMASHFNQPKPDFLCMVLKYKRKSFNINNMIPGLRRYNKESLIKYRSSSDEDFCSILGPRLYHSYGSGWNPKCFKGPVPSLGEKIINNRVVTPISGEFPTISKYKYNFCPENSMFDGYVTEKPIHAMFCGSIPLYLGAPDVESYLPRETFIDLRHHTILEACDKMLTMSEREYNGYQKAMHSFITTSQSDNFSSYIFAKKLVSILEEKL